MSVLESNIESQGQGVPLVSSLPLEGFYRQTSSDVPEGQTSILCFRKFYKRGVKETLGPRERTLIPFLLDEVRVSYTC